MIRWKRSWAEQSEALPVDVLPCSNGEFIPPPPTQQQLAIMALAEHETDRWARRFGMSRRRFVRTAAATTIGLWAIDAVGRGRFGHYALADDTETTNACDLAWTGQEGDDGKGTLLNLPGEFVFDVQSHHVDPEGLWRVNNPAIHAFFAAIWPQSSALTGDRPGIREDGSIRGGGAGEIDPIENLSRFHYLKELFLDSATTATVLSCVPSSPDTTNPLPIAEAAATVDTVNQLAGAVAGDAALGHARVRDAEPRRRRQLDSWCHPGLHAGGARPDDGAGHHLRRDPPGLEDVLRVGRRPQRQRLVPRRPRHRPPVPRAGAGGERGGALGPAGRGDAQGLRPARLRPALGRAARRRAGRRRVPGRALRHLPLGLRQR